MRRLIVDGATSGDVVDLGREDAHYLRDVVRVRVGSELEILDGRGGVFRAVYAGASPARVVVHELLPHAETPPLQPVTVAMAMVRGPRMDMAVEKLSELGIQRLVPLVTERSRAIAREARWERVAAAAARQCGRSDLLEVTEACSLSALPARLPADVRGIVLDPTGEPVTLAQVAGSHIVVIAGPEGGFTAEERAQLSEYGYASVAVARTVLRSETAAVVGAAIVVALRLSLAP